MAHAGLPAGFFSCIGKIKYNRESTAITAKIKMEKKLGQKMEAYKCRHCPAWHIGHPRRYPLQEVE